jgi:hypothetical protein
MSSKSQRKLRPNRWEAISFRRHPVLWRMVASVKATLVEYTRRCGARSARKLDQARREAYAEGLAAGRQQAEEQFRPAVQGLAETLDSLARLRETFERKPSRTWCIWPLDCRARDSSRSGRGSGRAGGADPSGVFEVAIARDQPRAHASHAGSPGSQAAGAGRRAEEPGADAGPSLKPAEVFFETSQGILDASVETQLREIERGLIDKLER